MQAVMKFAINNLEFEPEQIVLFGWSIGGFILALVQFMRLIIFCITAEFLK